MKMPLSSYLVLFSICSFSAYSEDVSWSAKSTDRQAGNVLATLQKSSTQVSQSPAPESLEHNGSDANNLLSSQVGISDNHENPNLNSAAKAVALAIPQLAKKLAARPAATHVNGEYWVYDAYVTLYTDSDYDGYYHHFSVDFDVDTQYAHADVYARLYLGTGDEFREYHTTADFHIDGDSTDDQLTVETELLSGFYPDDYEILIEIYDAVTNELVAVADGYTYADLYLVSIESQDNEVIYVEPDVLVVEASGGSTGWFILFLVPVALVRIFAASRLPKHS